MHLRYELFFIYIFALENDVQTLVVPPYPKVMSKSRITSNAANAPTLSGSRAPSTSRSLSSKVAQRNPEFPVGLQTLQEALSTRFVYRRGGFECIAFNGMQDFATEPASGDVSAVSPRNLRCSYLHSNKHPFAACVLRDPKYKDRFLSRLDVAAGSILHVSVTDTDGRQKYRLEEGLKGKWMSFEVTITKIVQLIESGLPSPNPDFFPPPKPSEYGFAEAYATYEDLERHVLDSKHTFDLHVAYAAYVISTIAPHRTKELDNPAHVFRGEDPRRSQKNWPVWCRMALEQHRMEPAFLHSFLFSEIFDFRQQRSGAFILLDTCQFLDKVPALLCC